MTYIGSPSDQYSLMKCLQEVALETIVFSQNRNSNREDKPLSAHPPYPILMTIPTGLLLSPDYWEILLKDLSSSIDLLRCRLMDML